MKRGVNGAAGEKIAFKKRGFAKEKNRRGPKICLFSFPENIGKPI